jgi:3-keto-5-aminohexanoate cleavage enzyme
MKKLIIEVRMNEAAKKADNPNVPYTPDEIVADALACAEAGATAVHFHARNADGAESNRIEDYRQILAGVRAKSDVMVHPTLGLFHGADPDQRLAHIRDLSENSNLKPDIAPLDMGSNNVDRWDLEAGDFRGEGFVYRNTTADLRVMAERLKAWGVKPEIALWNVANGRLMGRFIDAGLLKEPVLAVLTLGGEEHPWGHPATSAGLRAYVDNLPDRRIEWTVLGHGANLVRLAPEIIALGGHISIGLGDYAYAEFGRPSNAELVRRVAEIARTMGREVATPREAREMLEA